MEMGTGKTRVAIELIHSTKSDYALFICPFSTKQNLQAEINLWGLQIDYTILGYETLSSSDRTYLEIQEKIKGKKLFIVADESIFIKNDLTKRFQRTLKIAEKSEYRLILNGTPITKNEWDLYNQMYFLSPRIIGMSRQEFQDTFFTKVEYKKKFQRPRVFYKLSEVNIDYLHKIIDPYIFKVDFQFDKKITETVSVVEASKETKNKYRHLRYRLIQLIENFTWMMDILALIKKEVFTDPERCKAIGQSLEGQQIVYCSYLDEIKRIKEHCDSYVITGETKEEERKNIIQRFRNDNKPLLITFGVGSFGLNLQFCNKITFASITFDYGQMEQAKARIKRIGQESDIEYHYIASNLGIYDMIFDNLTNKQNLSETLIKKMKQGDRTWVGKI